MLIFVFCVLWCFGIFLDYFFCDDLWYWFGVFFFNFFDDFFFDDLCVVGVDRIVLCYFFDDFFVDELNFFISFGVFKCDV